MNNFFHAKICRENLVSGNPLPQHSRKIYILSIGQVLMQKRAQVVSFILLCTVLSLFLLQLVVAVDASTTTDTSVTATPSTTDTQTRTDDSVSTPVASAETSVQASVTSSDSDETTSTESTEATANSSDSDESASIEAFADAQFDRGAGITPDSNFYFVEKVFENFRSDTSNREKKFAEVRQMIQEEKYDDARTALAGYKEYADKLERNVAPENKEEAQRSAAAIRNAIAKMESQIPAEQKKEFVDDIRQQEELISKAADVAAKISKLCAELAKLDPGQYATTCKADKDAPKWRQKQDKQLTDAQRDEVGKFKDIMLQCMKTQGKECKCQDISAKEFATRCSVVAPLVDACENKGDKEACEKMDDVTRGIEGTLPDYLQDAFADVEEEMNKEQFGRFMPEECVKAGAKTPEACALIMIETHAPEECKAELKKQKVTNERDARRICEAIMFEKNAPQECVDAGVKSPKECGTFMCKNNFPQECIDAGLSCESKDAPMKCQALMGSPEGKEGRGQSQFAPALGSRCREIKDAEDRLKCFDSVDSAVHQFSGQFESGSFDDDFNSETRATFEGFAKEGGDFNRGPQTGPGTNSKARLPRECSSVGATTKEACEKILIQENQNRFSKQRQYEENFARDCLNKGGRWDCGFGSIDRSNPCRCFNDERQEFRSEQDFRQGQDFNRPPQGQCFADGKPVPCDQMRPREQQPQQEFRPPEQFQPPQQGTGSESTSGSSGSGSTSDSGSTSTTSGSSGGISSDSGSTSSGSSGSTSSGTSVSAGGETSAGTSSGSTADASASATVTGGVIAGDNSFLDYYFR